MMEVSVAIENINKTAGCNFGQKCLEGFDSSLCCEIVREGSHYLFTSPVSTFKSTNCLYSKQINKDGKDVHICTCPIRLEIFRKYQI